MYKKEFISKINEVTERNKLGSKDGLLVGNSNIDNANISPEVVSSQIKNLELWKTTFTNTSFENLTFKKSSFRTSSFDNCKFYKCKFVDCFFEFIDFTNCSFNDCDFGGGEVNCCVFDDCLISKTWFNSLRFRKNDLKCSKIEIHFVNCTISKNNFKNSTVIKKFKILRSELVDNKWKYPILLINAYPYNINIYNRSLITVGCSTQSLEYWIEEFNYHTEQEEFTNDMIKAYKGYIQAIKAFLEQIENN